MKSFKVGEHVVVLPRNPREKYLINYASPMEQYAGEVYKVTKRDGDTYRLKNVPYWFSGDMLMSSENYDPTPIM